MSRRPIVIETPHREGIELEEECRCCLPGAREWCEECRGSGIAMTYQGEQIVEFVRRWLLIGVTND